MPDPIHTTCPACGWVSSPARSQALADRALRSHSCERHRQRQAAAERGRQRRAAVDRTPKPCLHKQARHQHGTHACYVLDRCRCPDCSRANAAYERHRQRQTGYGRWQPYTDPQPVREHLQALADAGIGLKTVARRSGVGHGTLWKLVYGVRKPDGTRTPTRRIRHTTAAAILTVRPDDVADGALVSAIGVHRRLQALIAAGWSRAKLGQRIGVQPGNFTGLLIRPRCTEATARKVRDLYDELALRPPPEDTWRDRIAASRARNDARRNGWRPPAWWEPEWLDDPSFHPSFTDDRPRRDDIDHLAVEQACAGHPVTLTVAERRVAVLRLSALGMTPTEVALRLHIHRDTAQADLKRAS